MSSTAIATVVTVTEILKNNGFAVEKSKIFATYTKSFYRTVLISGIIHTYVCVCVPQSIYHFQSAHLTLNPYIYIYIVHCCDLALVFLVYRDQDTDY